MFTSRYIIKPITGYEPPVNQNVTFRLVYHIGYICPLDGVLGLDKPDWTIDTSRGENIPK